MWMIKGLTTGDLFVELLINNWDIAQATRILESMVSMSSSLRILDEPSIRTAKRVSNEFGTGSVRQVDVKEPENGFFGLKICLLKMRPTSTIFFASSSERSCDIDSDSKDPTVAFEVKNATWPLAKVCHSTPNLCNKCALNHIGCILMVLQLEPTCCNRWL